jgi:hypothetical protein
MPDRLSDITNVKDWGAVANYRRKNDTAAVQAAINFCISRGGGIVSFPPGSYLISTLTVGSSNPNAGVQLVGSGKRATQLFGGSTAAYPLGFMISKGSATYDNIERIEGLSVHGQQTPGCGAIRITANTDPVSGLPVPNCASIINCNVGGGIGIDTSTAIGVYIRDIGPMSGPINNAVNSTTPGPTAGFVGIYLGTQCTLAECRIQGGMDVCFALSGKGASIMGGCAAEVNRIGVRVGWAPNATTGLGEERAAYGCTVQAFQTERCDIGIDLYNCTGGLISGNTLTGTSGPYSAAAPINNVKWSAGTQLVTVTTTNPHNLPAGVSVLVMVEGTPSGFRVNEPRNIVVATRTGTNTFTYPGITVAPTPNPSTGGQWTFPMKYNIRCRKVYSTVITGTDFHDPPSIADLDLEYPPTINVWPPTGTGQADHLNNTLIGCNAGLGGFALPTTTARNLSAWRFISTGSPFVASKPTTASIISNPVGKLTFAALPASPIEGMEFDVSDSTLAATAANFGATVGVAQSGGTNHVKVRWDGAAWRII